MNDKSDHAEQMRKKQEASYAHRLWVLQTAYEKSLDGEETNVGEIAEQYNITIEQVVSAFKILEKQMLMTHHVYSIDGIPHGLEITGLAIYQIENAPVLHYNELETDVKELQSTNAINLKELEIKRLKEETKLKKWEVWINVTSSMEKASKWFGLLFGGPENS